MAAGEAACKSSVMLVVADTAYGISVAWEFVNAVDVNSVRLE